MLLWKRRYLILQRALATKNNGLPQGNNPNRESLKSRLKALENRPPLFSVKRKLNPQISNKKNGLENKAIQRKEGKSEKSVNQSSDLSEMAGGSEDFFAIEDSDTIDGDSKESRNNNKKGAPLQKGGFSGKMLAKEREKMRKERLAMKEERLKMNSNSKKEKGKKVTQRTIQLQEGVTVNNLAILLDVPLRQLQRTMINAGFDEYPADYVLNSEVASLLVMEFNMIPIVKKQDSSDLVPRPEPDDWSKYPQRPPVLVIMGHVDHGKTTLLDSLRKTSVAAGEAGGITQHIGAFSVKLPPPSNKVITFLDTPGHAAFSNMRQRGANVTDIAVLVVAADDGVMPQTVEAIQHSLKARVPIIVAINKCDKPGVDPQKIKQDLLRYEIVIEEMGGEIPAVQISGKTGMGLNELEETILAMAEVADYRGDPSGPVEAIVVESKHSKQYGPAATIIVKRGTLKPGTILVAGNAWCKVKRMVDEYGRPLKEVGPSGPVEVLGWKELPEAGDQVLESETEMFAKKVVANRKRKQETEASLKAIDAINQKRAETKAGILKAKEKAKEEKQRYRHNLHEKKQEVASNEYRIILKGDVHGSVEAIEGVINELPNHEVYCNIVSSGVGAVTESDIEFARVTNATIFAFNVPIHKTILNLAEESKVTISSHTIIYTLVDTIKERLSDLLEPDIAFNVVGEATVQAIFPITVKKKIVENIAGCKIMSGKITRQGDIRVIRNGKILHEGKIKTLKHHKKDILEANKGMECGINVEDFQDVLEGDMIQSISKVVTKRQFA